MATDITPTLDIPAVKVEKTTYFFPERGVSVQATSTEEAIKLAGKVKNG